MRLFCLLFLVSVCQAMATNQMQEIKGIEKDAIIKRLRDRNDPIKAERSATEKRVPEATLMEATTTDATTTEATTTDATTTEAKTTDATTTEETTTEATTIEATTTEATSTEATTTYSKTTEATTAGAKTTQETTTKATTAEGKTTEATTTERKTPIDYLVSIRSSSVPSADYQYDAVGILQVLLDETRSMATALPQFLKKFQLEHESRQWKLCHACRLLLLPNGVIYMELYEHTTGNTIYLLE
ncbi:hypothetical protein GWI33_017085 [Rhynchophorus ferrugineus]|uniref:Uncharacterized protein n=1 Tax=Rhynchophorus ferrugineus TaxID=354439 RepID=A0A834HXE7_RHYFE|nr:hypothetical protein GWI33_017085 [Rhynchophorus ferrugineus]